MNEGTIDRGVIYPGMMAEIPGQHEIDVVLSFRFKADRSRVLYALSIPEYIEVWLRAPDTDLHANSDRENLQFVFDPVAQDRFRIDLYRSGALRSSVDGCCQVAGANQVRYVWAISTPLGATETLVDMKLLSASGGCVLALRHSGMLDPQECAWCSRMWHQSLERLSKLVERN